MLIQNDEIDSEKISQIYFTFLSWFQSSSSIHSITLSNFVLQSNHWIMIGTETPPTVTASSWSNNGPNHYTNHPYFLHSSDAPSMTVVNSPFDGRGFSGWRRSVLIALLDKNKLGFIDGSCDVPHLTSKDHPLWSRCNDMVTSWLLNSLSKRYWWQCPLLKECKGTMG